MSYSEYYEDLDPYYTEHLGEKFCTMRGRILGLLSEENKLMEIVKLIGSDVLPDSQKVVIETARVIPDGLSAAERFPQKRHLCAAGQTDVDDGGHSPPV